MQINSNYSYSLLDKAVSVRYGKNVCGKVLFNLRHEKHKHQCKSYMYREDQYNTTQHNKTPP
jgi:hypothetical protein